MCLFGMGLLRLLTQLGAWGEKAKQTVKAAWDAAKQTTQKIKETEVGKDDKDDYKREKTMDEDALEYRRKAARGEIDDDEDVNKRKD